MKEAHSLTIILWEEHVVWAIGKRILTGVLKKKRYQQMVDIEKSVFLQPKKIKEKY